jgi:hypothetical protein
VELGIIIVLLLALTMGVVQFGHAFMVANMVTHAARDGARIGASWAARDTNTCGRLPSTVTGPTGPIATTVLNEIATVASTAGFTVNVCQGNDGTQACPPGLAVPAPPNCGNPATPVVIVNVQGCVPYLMNIFALGTPCGGGARGFTVNRSVWFRDERRG